MLCNLLTLFSVSHEESLETQIDWNYGYEIDTGGEFSLSTSHIHCQLVAFGDPHWSASTAICVRMQGTRFHPIRTAETISFVWRVNETSCSGGLFRQINTTFKHIL